MADIPTPDPEAEQEQNWKDVAGDQTPEASVTVPFSAVDRVVKALKGILGFGSAD
jgi:hypothetical protein